MKFAALSLLLVSHLLPAYYARATVDLPRADSSWEEVGTDDGVTTHRKKVEGSDFVAFRGETVVNATLAKVANVLIDTPRKLEWVFRIREARDIRPMGPYERIEYNHTASGFFLVKDRDFVFHAKADLDKAKQQLVFNIRSVEDAGMPVTNKVRGQINEGRYILTSIDGGKRTHVVVEIHADPKGSVPKWLVNLFQKSWPVKTLRGIAKQCEKPDVAEHPGIKAFFAGR